MPKALASAVLLTAAILVACSPGADQETRTETIAPAVPPPAAASDDPGLTQTTEIGEERSPSEGAALSGESEPESTTTTTGSPPPQPKRKGD